MNKYIVEKSVSIDAIIPMSNQFYSEYKYVINIIIIQYQLYVFIKIIFTGLRVVQSIFYARVIKKQLTSSDKYYINLPRCHYDKRFN